MLLKLFITFFKTGAFTFGGGYAMLGIIEQEIVDKHKWIDHDEFIELIAVTQSAPGSIAINAAIFLGYKIAGLPGAIVSGFANALPSFMVIFLIVKYFYGFRDNVIVDKVFKGIEPAVVTLILGAAFQLFKNTKFNKIGIGVILVALFLLMFTKISPIYLILFAGVGNVIYNKLNMLKKE